MQRKRLEDMNLLDDFLFNAVMTFPGIGERLLTVKYKLLKLPTPIRCVEP